MLQHGARFFGSSFLLWIFRLSDPSGPQFDAGVFIPFFVDVCNGGQNGIIVEKITCTAALPDHLHRNGGDMNKR